MMDRIPGFACFLLASNVNPEAVVVEGPPNIPSCGMQVENAMFAALNLSFESALSIFAGPAYAAQVE